MKIGDVETRTGITKQNVRFYEKKGLLHPKRGAENNYREYTEEDVETLKLIKILRRLDIPIEDIRHVLDGEIEMDAVIQAHLRILQEKKDGLDAVIRMCRFLLKADGESFAVDEVLCKMDEMEKRGGRFMSIINDYKKVSKAECKRDITIYPDSMVLNPSEFTEALCQYAEENHRNLVITKEGMYPVFEIDGVEYTAYRRHGRYGAVIYCSMTHPELLEEEYKDVPDRRRKLLQYLYRCVLPLTVLLGICLFLCVVSGSIFGFLLSALILFSGAACHIRRDFTRG